MTSIAMTLRTLLPSILAAVVALCGYASGASITTLYNKTSTGSGNMFDVTTFDDPVRINSLDIHTEDTSGNRTLRVYTRPETYAGHETSSAGWTLHSVIWGITGQGQTKATPVDIHDLYLPPGTTTGVYVTYESGNLAYTNPVHYPNMPVTYGGEGLGLQLDLGNGVVSHPFAVGSASNVYAPRIWNGTVYYDAIGAIPEAQSQIFIDAGNAGVFGPESKWNTVHAGMSGVPIALYDPVGVPTGVTATLDSGWTNSSANIPVGAYAGTILAEATNDYMYLLHQKSTATLTLDGLADAWYRVEMSASRDLSTGVREQTVTLNGVQADGDHTGENFKAYVDGYTNGTILLWRARPTDGTLTLAVSRDIGDAYLNALVVTQFEPQIFIDAGNVHVPGAYSKWNTIDAGMTGPIALYDPDGVPTGATVTIGGTWTNTADSSDQTGKIAITHPILAEASNDSIWLGDALAAQTGTLTFEGLPEPEGWQWYRFEMSASRSQQALPRWQDVTVNGQYADSDHNGQHFNAYQDGYLTGEILYWDFVRPDEDGLITLAISTGVNEYGYLNALVITLLPEPSTGLLLLLGGLSMVLQRRRRNREN